MSDDTKKTEPEVKAPVKKPVPMAPTRPATMAMTVKRTGLEEADADKGYVVVVEESYVHGAVHLPGAIIPWPKGVEKLGSNLKPYEG